MERFPSVGGYMRRYLLILVSAQPLPQTVKMHMTHRTGTFAGRDKGVLLLIVFFAEADSAQQLTVLARAAIFASRILLRIFNELIYFVNLQILATDPKALRSSIRLTHHGVHIEFVLFSNR